MGRRVHGHGDGWVPERRSNPGAGRVSQRCVVLQRNPEINILWVTASLAMRRCDSDGLRCCAASRHAAALTRIAATSRAGAGSVMNGSRIHVRGRKLRPQAGTTVDLSWWGPRA